MCGLRVVQAELVTSYSCGVSVALYPSLECWTGKRSAELGLVQATSHESENNMTSTSRAAAYADLWTMRGTK